MTTATITITPDGIAVADGPLVAGERVAVSASGLGFREGAEPALVARSRATSALLSTATLVPADDGGDAEWAGELDLATRPVAVLFAGAAADAELPVALELVDTAHADSVALLVAPLRNSALVAACRCPAATLYVPGPPGDAATVEVGETVTLPSGSPATVRNTGTPNAAVLAFGIPEGPPGPQGERAEPDLIRDEASTTVLRALPGSAGVTLSLSAPPCAVGHCADPAATLRADRPLAELVAGTPAPVRLTLEIGGATHDATATLLSTATDGEADYALTSATSWLDGALLAVVADPGMLVLFGFGQGAPAGVLPFPDAADEPGAPVSSPVATVRDLSVPAPLSDDSPGPDGTASAGVSAFAARADHVHPTDTTRMPATATGSVIPFDNAAGAGDIASTTQQLVNRARQFLRIFGDFDTPSASVALQPGRLVYRLPLPASGAIPPLYLTSLGAISNDSYLCAEIELRVPDPAPASVTAPASWTFVPDAPLPSSVTAGQTLHLTVRVDGTDQALPVLASCWLVS